MISRIVYLLAAIVVAALGTLYVKATLDLRAANGRAEVAQQRVTDINAKLDAQAALVEETTRRHADAVETIKREQEQAQAVLSRRAADTEHLLGRLRQQLAKPVACPAAAPQTKPAPVVDATATSRELLGVCATRYAELARQADELRDRVIGLQRFIDTTK